MEGPLINIISALSSATQINVLTLVAGIIETLLLRWERSRVAAADVEIATLLERMRAVSLHCHRALSDCGLVSSATVAMAPCDVFSSGATPKGSGN
jgi:hypothetical protein